MRCSALRPIPERDNNAPPQLALRNEQPRRELPHAVHAPRAQSGHGLEHEWIHLDGPATSHGDGVPEQSRRLLGRGRSVDRAREAVRSATPHFGELDILVDKLRSRHAEQCGGRTEPKTNADNVVPGASKTCRAC